MSETKESDNKSTSRSGKSVTLSLKRTVEAGHVRQNFSHGRSKSVVVEKKKRRTITAPASPGRSEKSTKSFVVETKKRPASKTDEKASADTPKSRGDGDGNLGRKLSKEEKEARLRALAAARIREAEEKKRAEEEARRRAEEEERRRREEEEARRRAEAEAAERAARGDDAAPAEAEPSAAAEAAIAGSGDGTRLEGAEGTEGAAKGETAAGEAGIATAPLSDATAEALVPPTAPPSEKRSRDGAASTSAREKPRKSERQPSRRLEKTERRTRGRLTINNALDETQRERSLASLRRRREREKSRAAAPQPREKISREVVIPEVITIQELANRMAERAVDIIKFLMKQGEMHKINDVIDADTAELIVEEFGHTAKRVSEADVEEGLIGEEDDPASLVPRPPVVTVMGHVDHGKTSLLDAIREANVVAGEAGGITQHIGAYQVETENGGRITFIDTPGHEAFTAMRSRGAKVTDIVVLVVAADDGVMPQTVEAINHAKAGDVPIIVAINKIDKPDADPNRVRTELLQHEVIVESMSGETLEVEVSALKRKGLDDLLEAIQMQAELLELKANPDRNAEGVVIEAKLERGRGPLGTVLVQRGTLTVGQIVVAGTAWGKVRALIDDRGAHVSKAGPSTPVEVLGFNSAPEAGDQLVVVESEARAREITQYRERKRREALAAGTGTARTLEQMMSVLKEGGRKEFPLLVKADVQGSVEAIAGALEKLGTDEVAARIIHSGVGGITESDVQLAAASGAVIIAFNVRANAQARQAAERMGVEIRQYNIIYNVIDDVKAAMSGLLAPTIREHFLGNAEILEVFNISKVGKVAGCRVTEGRVERGANVRLIRDNVVIHEGRLSTLKRFKDEVKEVQVGQECGMAFENYQDLRKGDVIECFRTEEVKRTL